MSDQMLAMFNSYNAAKLAKAPPAVLAKVREDQMEIAMLIGAAAEYVEEQMAAAHGVADSLFLGPAA